MQRATDRATTTGLICIIDIKALHSSTNREGSGSPVLHQGAEICCRTVDLAIIFAVGLALGGFQRGVCLAVGLAIHSNWFLLWRDDRFVLSSGQHRIEHAIDVVAGGPAL